MTAVREDRAVRGGRAGGVPVPKEHGAWFVLLHCLVLGAAVSPSLSPPTLLVAVAAFLTFLSMQGIKQVARRLRVREEGQDLRLPRASVGFLAGAAGTGLAAVVGWDRVALLVWGLLSVALAGAYAWLFFHRRDRSVLGEWLGILGLTMAAGAVRTAGIGRLDGKAVLLWLIAFLYFGHAVPYVKLRVRQLRASPPSWVGRLREAKGPLLFVSFGLVAVSFVVGWTSLNGLLLVPFVLTLGKVLLVALRGEGPKSLAHVGYTEVAFSTLFVLLAVVDLRWAGWAGA